MVTSKLNVPFAHIEAGERSFSRSMPEEVNRLVADRLANVHFCVSQVGMQNLFMEGITESIHWVGDVMLDALIHTRPIARTKSRILDQLGIEPKGFCLVTIHRAMNTDNPQRLQQIISALNLVSDVVILPLHPRTQKTLSALNIQLKDHVRIVEPVGYFDMLTLEENARLIATDSGGVQREAYYMSIPCLTLRDETEWGATIETGWNKLVGADQKLILENWNSFVPPVEHPAIYGTGTAGQRIAEILKSPLSYEVEQNSAFRNNLNSLGEVNSK
jgi:UDP-N-acetylglucosamine 2-epimerase